MRAFAKLILSLFVFTAITWGANTPTPGDKSRIQLYITAIHSLDKRLDLCDSMVLYKNLTKLKEHLKSRPSVLVNFGIREEGVDFFWKQSAKHFARQLTSLIRQNKEGVKNCLLTMGPGIGSFIMNTGYYIANRLENILDAYPDLHGDDIATRDEARAYFRKSIKEHSPALVKLCGKLGTDDYLGHSKTACETLAYAIDQKGIGAEELAIPEEVMSILKSYYLKKK